MPKAYLRGGYLLRDSPFYKLSNRKTLAKLLRTSPSTLVELSRGEPLYKRRWKHKKLEQWLNSAPAKDIAHQYRPIDIPDPRLKAVQARIANILARIEPPDFLFSPVKGRSYVQNAASHVGNNAFHLMDVADYFPSCTSNNIARFFRQDMNCSSDLVAVLVRLVTLNGCLPQGSPCSPILAYYCNRPMWLSISEVVKDAGCQLSVYADDITISGTIVKKSMVWDIKKIIYRNGLRLNKSKETSLINSPADITGVIVKPSGTHLPNRQMKKLAELRAELTRTADQETAARLRRQIDGRIAQKRQVEQTR